MFALPPGTYQGYPVVIREDLPREHVGDHIVPVPWPLPVRWLLGLFGPVAYRRFERGAPLMREQVFFLGGTMYMSRATYHELRSEHERQRS